MKNITNKLFLLLRKLISEFAMVIVSINNHCIIKYKFLFALLLFIGFLSLLTLKTFIYLGLTLNNEYFNLLRLITVLYFCLLLIINVINIKQNINILYNNELKLKIISLIIFNLKIFSILLLFQFILNIIFNDFNIFRNTIFTLILIIVLFSIIILFYYNNESKKFIFTNIVDKSFSLTFILFSVLFSLKLLFFIFNFIYNSSSSFNLYADSKGATSNELQIHMGEDKNTIVSSNNELKKLNLSEMLDFKVSPDSAELHNFNINNQTNYTLSSCPITLGASSSHLDLESRMFLNDLLTLELKLAILDKQSLVDLSVVDKTQLIILQLNSLRLHEDVSMLMNEERNNSFLEELNKIDLDSIENLIFDREFLYNEKHIFFKLAVKRAVYFNTQSELILGYLDVFDKKHRILDNNISFSTLLSLTAYLMTLPEYKNFESNDYMLKLSLRIGQHIRLLNKE